MKLVLGYCENRIRVYNGIVRYNRDQKNTYTVPRDLMAKRPTNMHAEDVKAKVHKKRTSLSALGRKNDLPEVTVRAAIRRPIPSANIIIADFLEMSLNDIWPEWYNEEGIRIKGVSDTLISTRSKTKCHRQKRTAA